MTKTRPFDVSPGESTTLPKVGSWPETEHVFEDRAIWATRAAIASGRPLLVMGEPGCGKSQLARAAAAHLGYAFIGVVVQSFSQCRDLQYHFDAVGRLGQAQAIGAMGRYATPTSDAPDASCEKGLAQDCPTKESVLDLCNYYSPGPLWWAFNWTSAETQYQTCPSGGFDPGEQDASRGCVILIDEIDKAESDLPNGLLEALGNMAFTVPGLNQLVAHDPAKPPPLVFITTNEERELPPAFVRRCMVYKMDLPKGDALRDWLIERGSFHYKEKCDPSIIKEAAIQLCKDREDAARLDLIKPGQAEFLDLLQAVSELGSSYEDQKRALDHIKDFAYVKHDGQGTQKTEG